MLIGFTCRRSHKISACLVHFVLDTNAYLVHLFRVNKTNQQPIRNTENGTSSRNLLRSNGCSRSLSLCHRNRAWRSLAVQETERRGHMKALGFAVGLIEFACIASVLLIPACVAGFL